MVGKPQGGFYDFGCGPTDPLVVILAVGTRPVTLDRMDRPPRRLCRTQEQP